MLWISFLLCHHETEVGPSGSLPTKPPICLVLSVTNCNCSGFLFFFILYLGSGRNSKDLKKKKKKSAVKSLRSSQKSLRLFAHL